MANGRRAKNRKTGRLNLRLRDEAFVEQVHAYAERHGTKVTALVEGFLVKLLESERNVIEVEQG